MYCFVINMHRAVGAKYSGCPVICPVIDIYGCILIIDQPYEQAKPNESIALTRAETEPDELAIGPVQTKNKFRGLFRRVTRVVEKTTHIPTGENKRLLIGNLEIALK